MDAPSVLLYITIVIVVMIFGWVVVPTLDRNRIRENIEKHGGKVVEITRVWGWNTRNDRAYEISYMTARGKQVKATCRTNMWRGVYWVNDHPPGFDSEMAVTSSFAGEAPQIPAGPIRCLGCGSILPANHVRCSQCGWSYKGS